MIRPNETVSIGWCDNGMVDGRFTEGLISIILAGAANSMPIASSIRVQGNQIARQRQSLLDHWYDKTKSDWLLWVDSDVVVDMNIWKLLHDTADKDTHPMVSGIYFIGKDKDGSIPIFMPVIFDDIDEYTVKYHHPLPPNQVLKIDMAGMGFVVMHRDVVTKLREKYGNEVSFFAENDQKNDKFVGEDISFFRKCKATGIPLHAHTGAIAKHMKTTVWDMDLYTLFWSMQHVKDQLKAKQTQGE
jgi:hypothetical protein